jgi:hypothetical protein
MSSFDEDERSTRQNRPIELYTFQTPTATYHLTSHVVDVAFGGTTYAATTMSRGAQQVAQDLTGRELIVYLPITHPIIRRFAASGIPEHSILVTLRRLQSVSGAAVLFGSGFAAGMSIDGHLAAIRVPSVTDDAMKVRLPVIRAQRLCNHTLYDSLCTVARGSFFVGTTVAATTSATLVVAGMGGQPDQWATYGEALHTATAQRRQVLQQIGNTLTLNMPIVGAQPGDGLSVFAGCAHDVITCRDKFGNVVNFGGLPHMVPAFAPWSPGAGLSSVQQP